MSLKQLAKKRKRAVKLNWNKPRLRKGEVWNSKRQRNSWERHLKAKRRVPVAAAPVIQETKSILWNKAKRLKIQTGWIGTTKKQLFNFVNRQPNERVLKRRLARQFKKFRKSPKKKKEQNFDKTIPLELILKGLTKFSYRRKEFIYFMDRTFRGSKKRFFLNDDFLKDVDVSLDKNLGELTDTNFENPYSNKIVDDLLDPRFTTYSIVRELIFMPRFMQRKGKKLPSSGYFPYRLPDWIFHPGNANETAEEGYELLLKTYRKYVYNNSYSDHKNKEWDRNFNDELDCVGWAIKMKIEDEAELNEEDRKFKPELLERYKAFRMMKTSMLSLRTIHLGQIFKELGIKVIIHIDNRTQSRLERGMLDSEIVIEIGMYKGHAFLYEKTPFTKYAVENCKDETLIYQRDWNFFSKNKSYKNGRNRKKTLVRNSMDFLRTLVRSEIVVPLTQNEIMKSIYSCTKKSLEIDYSKVDDLTCDFDTEVDHKKPLIVPFSYKDKETGECEYHPYTVIYADFEARTDEAFHLKECLEDEDCTCKTTKHVPICLVCFDSYVNRYRLFKGEDCATQFLDYIQKHKSERFLIYFHNLGYDYNFFPRVYGFHSQKTISPRASCIKMVKCGYFNKKIIIKDSLAVIPASLKKFGTMFKLLQEKEICMYDLYTKETCQLEEVSIQDAINQFPPIKDSEVEDYSESEKENQKKEKERERQQRFRNNIKKWKLEGSTLETFKHMEYMYRYCRVDVAVMRKGIEKFREWMKELTDVDIYDVVSLPQLANHFMTEEGAYDGVLKSKGVTREYQQKRIVGGRCMMAHNRRRMCLNLEGDDVIIPLDGRSLYPSAAARAEFKIPKGKGTDMRKLKVVPENNIQYLKDNFPYYEVDFKITKIGIRRAFPSVSYFNEKGIRMFVNRKGIQSGNIYSLEDLVEHQEIEFELINGIFWTHEDVFNNVMREVMKRLYSERLVKKKEIQPDGSVGNPIEKLYKLIMNSTYGRTIMKPIEEAEKYFTDVEEGGWNYKKYVVYIRRHYNSIKHIYKYDGGYSFKRYDCKAEDFVKLSVGRSTKNVRIIKIKPKYNHLSMPQAGDIILSLSKRIMNEVMYLAENKRIEILYQDTDSCYIRRGDIPKLEKKFEKKYGRKLLGEQMGQFHNDFDYNYDKGTPQPHATDFIMIGKKVKYCRVKCVCKGNVVYHDSITMAGIPEMSVRYKCKQLGITVLELYKHLYYGKEYYFDMLCGGEAVSFRMENYVNQSMKVGTFSRKRHFPYNEKLLGPIPDEYLYLFCKPCVLNFVDDNEE